MALSRTARILIAILLLAAAAFFWVNFFYQSRLAEAPAQDPVTATPAPMPDAASPDVDAAAPDVGAADVSTDAADPDAATSDPDAVPDPTDADDADADADEVAADDDAVVSDVVVVDEPAAVTIDPAIAITRDVVIADLPFLITEPRTPDADADVATDATATVAVTSPSRATINPFSPVVVRTPPAPDRDVPAPSAAVGEVPVPGGPPGASAVDLRATAPTPGAVAPAAPVAVLSRELPSGAVLSSAPGLLRQPRVGTVADRVDIPSITAIAVPDPEPTVIATPTVDLRATASTPGAVAPAALVGVLSLEPPSGAVHSSAPDLLRQPRVGTVADRVDIPSITAIAVPDPEPTVIAAPAAPRPSAPTVVLAPVGPSAAAPVQDPDVEASAPSVTPSPPADPTFMAAGTTPLARFLRDNNYTFTGSVLGPVSVGVFRSNLDAAPVVVALGQTLPNTEIVLTDLRGMVAELTLGETTQILTLDLRR